MQRALSKSCPTKYIVLIALTAAVASAREASAKCVSVPTGATFWTQFDTNFNDVILGGTATLRHQAGVNMVAPALAPGKAVKLNDPAAVHYKYPNGQSPFAFNVSDFSVDFWVRLKLAADGYTPIFDTRGADGKHRGVLIWSDTQVYKHGKYGQLGYSIQGDTQMYAPRVVSIHDEKWHFISLTVGRTGPGDVKFYVDGKPIIHTPAGSIVGSVGWSNRMSLGHDQVSNYVGRAIEIDEVEVFNRVLSPSEIALLSAAAKCK